MAQPGHTPITPVGSQDFTGYSVPPQFDGSNWIYPWAWYFQPFNEYGGFEDTIKTIFDSH